MGRILSPHGVRGWVKVQPVSETPEALLDYPAWWIRPPGASAWRELRRAAARMHSGFMLASLAGVATREDALTLRGAEIGIPRAALPRPGKNEIYWVDLHGLDVVNRNGVALGTIAEVVAHGAHPLLRVTRPAGHPGPDRLIPYVSAIVDRVDMEGRRIEVDWGEDY